MKYSLFSYNLHSPRFFVSHDPSSKEVIMSSTSYFSYHLPVWCAYQSLLSYVRYKYKVLNAHRLPLCATLHSDSEKELTLPYILLSIYLFISNVQMNTLQITLGIFMLLIALTICTFFFLPSKNSLKSFDASK